MTDTTMLIAGAQSAAKEWKVRAEAAEARCARLEKAATALLSYYENSLNAGPGPRPSVEAALLRGLRAALPIEKGEG